MDAGTWELRLDTLHFTLYILKCQHTQVLSSLLFPIFYKLRWQSHWFVQGGRDEASNFKAYELG